MRSPPAVLLEVEGMMCQNNCGATVRRALEGVDGVERVVVSHPRKLAWIWGVSLDLEELVEAVEMVGFDATPAADRLEIEPPPASSPAPAPAPAPSAHQPAPVPLSTSPPPALATSGRRSVTLAVSGMSCASCVRAIEQGLLKLPGVASVNVALLAEKATVELSPGAALADHALVQHVQSLGYGAELVHTVQVAADEVHLEVLGMSCASCVSKVERALAQLPGVASAAVNLSTNRVRVKLQRLSDPSVGAAGPRDLVQAVVDLGFTASLVQNQDLTSPDAMEKATQHEVARWWNSLRLALIFTVPVLFIHWFGMSSAATMQTLNTALACEGTFTVRDFLMIALVTPVQFGVGARFYRAALLGAVHGNFGMDMLIVIGTSSAYLYSVAALILACTNPAFEPHIFFETSAMLFTFVSLGKFLEAVAKGKTSTALTMLMRLQPQTAVLLHPATGLGSESREEEIDIGMVQVGDLLRVQPGARVPADGKVVSGQSYVDEAMITGESMPVPKAQGDDVFGSTINQHGALVVRASAVGRDSALSQIVRLVEEAQLSKAPIQNFADRVAGIFTPVVLTLALATFATWFTLWQLGCVPNHWVDEDASTPFLFAFLFAISVVVVACPCALGLATPTAVMVGTGVGASVGILIKGGAALETAHQVTAVIFDKTGTLTTGKPALTQALSLAKHLKSDELLALAASAERQSEHPVARAIVGAAQSRGLPLQDDITDFQGEPGMGVACRCARGRLLLGTTKLLERHGVPLARFPNAASVSRRFESDGMTSVIVALDNEVVGVLAVTDTPRPEAAPTVTALKALGLEVWLVTGDNQITAQAVATQLGIDHVMASVLPGQKSKKVAELQMRGHTVAMVGDGINDSPALAQADVGVAVGAGTQIAVEAASIVLVRNDLRHVFTALDLSRVVFQRIKANFVWAMGYNVLLIPVAAGVLFPVSHIRLAPAYAGLAMAFSSVSVVMSSLALKLYTRPDIDESGSVRRTTCLDLLTRESSALLERVCGPAGVRYSRLHNDSDGEIELETGSLLGRSGGSGGGIFRTD